MAFWRKKADKDQRHKARGARDGRGESKGRQRQTKSLGGMVDLLETTLAEGARQPSKLGRKP